MDSPGREFECLLVSPAGGEHDRWTVPVETPVTLWVNDQPWATLLCTPNARRELALGFAYFGGLFECLDDVALVWECPDDPNQVKLYLRRDEIPALERQVITSGCGQGVIFTQLPPEVQGSPAEPVKAEQLGDLMRAMQKGSDIHRTFGGTHTSALSDGREILALYEDIGRHNTIDKLMGHSLLSNLETRGLILLTTGRISSEMMYKATKMGVSVVVSRTTPTDLAVDMARRSGMTLVGYVRGRRLTVFNGSEALE